MPLAKENDNLEDWQQVLKCDRDPYGTNVKVARQVSKKLALAGSPSKGFSNDAVEKNCTIASLHLGTISILKRVASDILSSTR